MINVNACLAGSNNYLDDKIPFCPYKQVFQFFTQCGQKAMNEPAGNKKSADKNIHAFFRGTVY
jgi:hypothetical protein